MVGLSSCLRTTPAAVALAAAFAPDNSQATDLDKDGSGQQESGEVDQGDALLCSSLLPAITAQLEGFVLHDLLNHLLDLTAAAESAAEGRQRRRQQ
jgi:hypothetical protein